MHKYTKIIMLSIAWGILPLGFLSWCFSTVSYQADYFMYLACLTLLTTILLYSGISKCITKQYEKLKQQFVLWDIILIGLSILAAIFIPREFEKKFWVCIYVVLAVSTVTLIYGLMHKKIAFREKIWDWLKTHKFLLTLLLIVLILCYDPNMYQFKWDGLLYYMAARSTNLGSVSSVSLYGHMAQTSGILYRIGALIYNNTGYGMILTNIIVLLVGTCAFYGSIKELIPGKGDLEYTIFTACFAFAPFTLGMVNYFSTDYFSVCLVNVLVYFVLKGKWVIVLPAACMFTLTKEPALIAYAGLCLGLAVKDIITAEGNLKDKSISVLRKVHYYFMLLPFIIWYSTYRILGQWSAGNGGVGIDIQYIIAKLKVFLILNFNWMATLTVLTCIVVLFFDKKRNEIVNVFPLIFSNIALLLFNCVYVTANHARYIDSFFSVNILLAFVMVCKVLTNEKSERPMMIVGVCVAIALLISSFVTIDPISRVVFEGKKTGNAYILSTGSVMLGDASIYNKQMLWLEKPLGQAIADASGEGDAIVLALPGQSVYAFDGMSEEINYNDRFEPDAQYWDDEKECRVSYADEKLTDGNISQFVIYHLPQDKTLDHLKCEDENKRYSVIYIKGINDYMLSDDYDVFESRTYDYRGWTVTRDIVIRK